jgi:hypothetical protein
LCYNNLKLLAKLFLEKNYILAFAKVLHLTIRYYNDVLFNKKTKLAKRNKNVGNKRNIFLVEIVKFNS